MIELLRPWALLLLPLPWLVWRFMPARINGDGLVLPERLVELIRPLDSSTRLASLLRRWRLVMAAIGWFALVFALAGPQGERTPLPSSSGRDLMIALDLSVSMRERDVQLGSELVTRAEAVKTLAGAFVRRREGDRVGLIAFADKPFLISPLTYDVRAVESFLDEVAVGLPGRKTAIGDAIGLAVEQLGRQPQQSRVVILLTDGDGNAGGLSAGDAAALAGRHDVRVHTIGFGGESGDGRGRSLAEVASATGGRHFSADDVTSLQRVYEALDALEPTVSERQALYVAHDYSRELLWIATFAAFFLMLGQPGWQLRGSGHRNASPDPQGTASPTVGSPPPSPSGDATANTEPAA